MTEEQQKLVGRMFRHFKMRLSPTAIRLPDEQREELLQRKSRKRPRNLYRLEGFAKDSETLEEMVVYRARPLATAARLSRYAPSGNPTPTARANLYGERGLWVRPAAMFFETIERDGKRMKRFELVEDRT